MARTIEFLRGAIITLAILFSFAPLGVASAAVTLYDNTGNTSSNDRNFTAGNAWQYVATSTSQVLTSIAFQVFGSGTVNEGVKLLSCTTQPDGPLGSCTTIYDSGGNNQTIAGTTTVVVNFNTPVIPTYGQYLYIQWYGNHHIVGSSVNNWPGGVARYYNFGAQSDAAMPDYYFAIQGVSISSGISYSVIKSPVQGATTTDCNTTFTVDTYNNSGSADTLQFSISDSATSTINTFTYPITTGNSTTTLTSCLDLGNYYHFVATLLHGTTVLSSSYVDFTVAPGFLNLNDFIQSATSTVIPVGTSTISIPQVFGTSSAGNILYWSDHVFPLGLVRDSGRLMAQLFSHPATTSPTDDQIILNYDNASNTVIRSATSSKLVVADFDNIKGGDVITYIRTTIRYALWFGFALYAPSALVGLL